MKFRSRVSILLLIVILVTFGFPLAIGSDHIAKFVIVAIPMIVALSILFTINYTIADDGLTIKCFGFKMATIDIAKIKSIKSSYNPISSPAASLRRLEVKFRYQGKLETAMISPVRETQFIAKLKEINPNIVVKITHKHNILKFWDWDI